MHDMPHGNCSTPPDYAQGLEKRYGMLMTHEEVVRELKFPSLGALRAARQRGALKLQAIKVPGRREHLYLTKQVADVLLDWCSRVSEETPM